MYGPRVVCAAFASIPAMSDDFGTVNVSRVERAREIEVMRQQYRHHREALSRLVSDAPTEHLASEYQRMIREIDTALGKLDELESLGGSTPPPVPPPAHEPAQVHGDPMRLKTEPGMRPLVTTPPVEDTGQYDATMVGGPDTDSESRSRLALIIAAAIVALALIGWLIWRASRDRGAAATTTSTVVEEPAETTTTTRAEEGTIAPMAPPPAAAVLVASPQSADYGTIRKGTRATRQFEVRNNSDEPVTVEVARSACRCLYYEYQSVVPPKGKETVTVTVDGARAKSGALRETVNVRVKANPSVATSFDVIATVQ